MCTFSDKSIQSHCSIDTRTRIQPAKHFVYLHIIIYGAIAIRQFGRIPFGSLDDQISPRLFHRPRGNSCFAWSPTCSSCLLSLRGVSESRSMVKRASCSFPLPNECTSPIPHLDSKTPELPAAKAKPSFNGWIRRNPRKTRVSRGLSPPVLSFPISAYLSNISPCHSCLPASIS